MNHVRLRYALFLIAWIVLVLAAVNGFYAVRFHETFVKGDSNWPEGSWRSHPVMGFEMTAGFAGPMNDGSFFVKGHRLGFRIPESADPSAVEPGGLLAIGCSFTYGAEVDAEEAFPHLAGEALGLPVYNYGVGSYSLATVLQQLGELERTGVLDELAPTLVVLGVGDWLPARSQEPLYPTSGLPYGYAYLAERGGRIGIVPPPSFYSLEHFFYVRRAYFPDGEVDSELTPSRFWHMFHHAPRVLAARLDQRFRIARPRGGISNARLYEFVLEEVERYADRLGAELYVLWMPHTKNLGIDPALDGLRTLYRIVDGGLAITRHQVPLDQYHGRHPQPGAHAAYARQIVGSVREARGAG